MRPNHNRGDLASKVKSFSRAIAITSGLAGVLSSSGGCIIHTTPNEVAQRVLDPFSLLRGPGEMARQGEKDNTGYRKESYRDNRTYHEPNFFVCSTVKDSDNDGKLAESDFINKKNIFDFGEPITAVAGFPEEYSGKIVGGKIILVSDESFVDSLPEGRISAENEFTWEYTTFTIDRPWWASNNTNYSVDYAVDWSLDGQFFKRYTFIVKK